MPSMKMIKRRISSVKNTQQIMKAMNLVAAAKLQKNKARLDSIRPLFENIKLVIDGIREGGVSEGSIFVEKREVKSIAYIILTSDRGLCGGYNINVSKEALAHMDTKKGIQEKLIVIGANGWDYFRRRGKNVIHRSNDMSDATVYQDAEHIGKMIVTMYTEGEVDEVYLAYTRFGSILSHTPCVEKLLPIDTATEEETAGGGVNGAGEGDGGGKSSGGDSRSGGNVSLSGGASAGGASGSYMTYDPDITTFIANAAPMYLSMYIFGAMVESSVCEQASRMTSMDAASRNSSEIIENLTLEFNRMRQGMITQGITEIVGGANALQ